MCGLTPVRHGSQGISAPGNPRNRLASGGGQSGKGDGWVRFGHGAGGEDRTPDLRFTKRTFAVFRRFLQISALS